MALQRVRNTSCNYEYAICVGEHGGHWAGSFEAGTTDVCEVTKHGTDAVNKPGYWELKLSPPREQQVLISLLPALTITLTVHSHLNRIDRYQGKENGKVKQDARNSTLEMRRLCSLVLANDITY